MLDRLVDLYTPFVDRFALVLSPVSAAAIQTHCAELGVEPDFAVQERPTGMLDALLAAREVIERHSPTQVWITWCDQVALCFGTVARLDRITDSSVSAAFPTVRLPSPYIHFVREQGRLSAVLQRREGDRMPLEGESDTGLFCLSLHAYLDDLPLFAAQAPVGARSGERNFLPFFPWLQRRAEVLTFPATHAIEAVGINDRDDLKRVEDHLDHAC